MGLGSHLQGVRSRLCAVDLANKYGEQAVLVDLLKIGGVAALSVGVMYLLYSQLMKMNIFRRMSQVQTFVMMMTMTFLVFFLALSALSSGGVIRWNTIKVTNSEGVAATQN